MINQIRHHCCILTVLTHCSNIQYTCTCIGPHVNNRDGWSPTCTIGMDGPHVYNKDHVKPLVMMIFVFQYGWSALMLTSSNGHLDLVKTLIDAGADMNQTDKVGILHYFCTL